MADDRARLTPGTRFGNYRIESLLGAGAMGAVYVATHLGLGKRVVVKVLHPERAHSESVRARFFREGRAAAAIRHPHVVDVTDVGEHEGVGYLVMEHLDGETLGALLAREGPLPADRAADLLLPVLAAIDAAHAAGIIHRDLKPENLFVARTATGEAHPKVLDFGISRVVHEGGRRTGTAAVLGTPAYMAPEQIESTRDADARSDQYALGVILYECVTGRPAFPGQSVYAILKRVGDGDFARPSLAPVALPPGLEAVILRAMAKAPEARFPSLRAFAQALLPYASERARSAWRAVFGADADAVEPVASPQPPPPATNPSHDTLVDAAQERDTAPRTRRRSARVFAVLATVVVAVATTVALRPWHGQPPAPTARPASPNPPTPPAAPPAVLAAPAPVVPVAPPVVTPPPEAASRRTTARRPAHVRRPATRASTVVVPVIPP